MMRNIVLVVLLAALAWYGYGKYQRHGRVVEPNDIATVISTSPRPTAGSFKCDGRTYCSQMTSCQEAQYFLQNCPGVKMDGDHNGVPCEQQWCK